MSRRMRGLWTENADAFRCYRALCGRTVADLEWRGSLLERWMDRWSLDETLSLLKRLDLILDILQPNDDSKESRTDHGRRPPDPA